MSCGAYRPSLVAYNTLPTRFTQWLQSCLLYRMRAFAEAVSFVALYSRPRTDAASSLLGQRGGDELPAREKHSTSPRYSSGPAQEGSSAWRHTESVSSRHAYNGATLAAPCTFLVIVVSVQRGFSVSALRI